MTILNIIALIFLGIMFFAQLLAASWYDLVRKTGDKKRAFKHKMICSLIYLATFLLCAAIGNALLSLFVILFFIAIILLFICDALEPKSTRTCSSLCASLSSFAYICLAMAMYKKNAELFSFNPMSTTLQWVVPLVIVAVCALLSIKLPKVSPALAVIYMVINAGLFAFKLQNGEPGLYQAASCAITLGAIALLISSTLPVFDKTDNKALLRTNTYYFGLMFISCSVAVL
jgi:hypothetical protein